MRGLRGLASPWRLVAEAISGAQTGTRLSCDDGGGEETHEHQASRRGMGALLREGSALARRKDPAVEYFLRREEEEVVGTASQTEGDFEPVHSSLKHPVGLAPKEEQVLPWLCLLTLWCGCRIETVAPVRPPEEERQQAPAGGCGVHLNLPSRHRRPGAAAQGALPGHHSLVKRAARK